MKSVQNISCHESQTRETSIPLAGVIVWWRNKKSGEIGIAEKRRKEERKRSNRGEGEEIPNQRSISSPAQGSPAPDRPQSAVEGRPQSRFMDFPSASFTDRFT